MKKIPEFDTKLYKQFLRECQECNGVQIEIKTPDVDALEVVGWNSILPVEYDKNKESDDDHACVITDWSDTYGDIKIPFSAFMSHKKPKWDGTSYTLMCRIEGDPAIKFTFLYSRTVK